MSGSKADRSPNARRSGRARRKVSRLEQLEQRVLQLEKRLGLAPKAPPKEAKHKPGPRCPGCRLPVASATRGRCPWCGLVLEAAAEVRRASRK